jgi:outer membrane protein assembly factor BamA
MEKMKRLQLQQTLSGNPLAHTFLMKAFIVGAALLFAQPEIQTPVIRSVKFENFKGISAGQVMSRLKDRGVRMAVEQPYEPQQVDAARRVLKELLEEKGRQGADVTSAVRQIPPRSVEVTFKLVKN